jgi:hypothetical protein
MQKAWDEVERCTKFGYHKKMLRKLSELSSQERLAALCRESLELYNAPDDLSKMADVAAILFSHAQMRGFTKQQLEDEIIRKVHLRVWIPGEKAAHE